MVKLIKRIPGFGGLMIKVASRYDLKIVLSSISLLGSNVGLIKLFKFWPMDGNVNLLRKWYISEGICCIIGSYIEKTKLFHFTF